MKVVWLAQYNVVKLLPLINLNQEADLHSSSWIHTLSETLAQREDIELHIITHTNIVSETQNFVKDRIHFHIVRYSFPFTNRGFPWFCPIDRLTGYHFFVINARDLIQQIKPDIIHVHGTEGGYFNAAYGLKVPCIISIQGIISEYVKVNPSILGYLQLPHEQFAIRKGEYFGCRTDFDFSFVKGLNKRAQIFDLPEAINNVFFEHKWEVKSDLILLFVGSIVKRKGIHHLLSAVAILKDQYPTINLRIIGTGQAKYVKSQKKFVREKNISSNITWLDSKNPTEIALELAKCTFFIFPSLIDNSPNSLAEAMAVGVPCVATNVGGIPSMIEHSISGMLIDKGSANQLAETIDLLANDLSLQKRISINAGEKAISRNLPSKVSKTYMDTYKSLLP